MGQLCLRREKSVCQKTPLVKQERRESENSNNKIDGQDEKEKKIRIALLGSSKVGKSSIFEQIEFTSQKQKQLSQTVTQEIGQQGDKVEIVSWTVSEEDQDVTINDTILAQFDGIAFVFDKSSSSEQLKKDGLLLRQIISSQNGLGLPLLILINKYDLKEGAGVWQVTQDAGLSFIEGREIHMQTCSAKENSGIEQGMNKLIMFIQILRSKKQK